MTETRGRTPWLAGAILCGALASAGTASSETPFPEPGRPFTLISNFAPGGVVQLALQDFQPYFEEQLGTRVVIETIDGAAGLIGYNAVFARPADCHTAVLASATYGPYIYPHLSQAKPPWKYEDWVSLGIYVDSPNPGIVTLKDSPYQTFADLIRAAKAEPNSITVGTIGPGRIEDVQIVELQRTFGVEFNHVYYDSGGTLFTDLLTGDLDAIVSAAIQYGDNPDVIVTMFTDNFPDTFPYPELAKLGDFQEELGFKVADFKTLNMSHFGSMVVKAGCPQEHYDKLVEVFRNVALDERWRAQVAHYRVPVYKTPEEAQVIFDRVNQGITELIALTR
jgi:tripartite-type tricarboxylate transporter receptor subunit TctC